MQASINGIPIVSPSWIDKCVVMKKLVLPEPGMYIRSLPTKTKIDRSPCANFGVAFLAAAKDYSASFRSGYTPFRNLDVFLCGFSCKNETTFSILLREGSAKDVLTNKQAALSKIKALAKEPKSAKMVIICNDSNVVFSSALEREVRNHASRVIVVSSQWLVDTVSCGVPLDPSAAYKPQGAKAQELWELTRTVTSE